MFDPKESWKLTAYILNELDADEMQSIRDAIASDSDLAEEVSLLRSTIDKAACAMKGDTDGIKLTDQQRASIESIIAGTSASDNKATASSGFAFRNWSRNLKWSGLSALAAGLLFMLWVYPFGKINKNADVAILDVKAELESGKDRQNGQAISTDGEALLAPGGPESAKFNVANGIESDAISDTTVLGRFDKQDGENLSKKMTAEVSNSIESKSLNEQKFERAWEPLSAQLAPTAASRPMSTTFGLKAQHSSTTELSLAEGMDRSKQAASSAAGPSTTTDSLELPAAQPLQDYYSTGGSPRVRELVPAYGGNPGGGYGGSGEPNTGRFMLGGSVDSDLAGSGYGEPVEDRLALGIESRRSSLSDGLSDGEVASSTMPTPDRLAKDLPVELLQNLRGGTESLYRREPSGDLFSYIPETPFKAVTQDPLSTFSIDVDTAAYSKMRQYVLEANTAPEPDSIRIEEWLNYFTYNYAAPNDNAGGDKGEDRPFAANMLMADCPWNRNHRLLRVGLQAKKVDATERPATNLVFLVDVSGSMSSDNKLPLVKKSLAMLARQMRPNDKIAIVVYAGAAGCVLPTTSGESMTRILDVLDRLQSGGSTNGAQGITLAYQMARDAFVPGGINRVILCTDGDFNVGLTSTESLVGLVKENAGRNIFLTCFGFGMGNYNDTMMEQICDQGNGVCGMIDNENEARRQMVERLSQTIHTVAKDVKIQIEFNPAKVSEYRLIGYENRRLANADFDNDRKDAGEINSGHSVTALYEIVLAGIDRPQPAADQSLRYSNADKKSEPVVEAPVVEARPANIPDEWLILKLRYKQPDSDTSSKIEFFLKDAEVQASAPDQDFKWASSIAEFGLLLRKSKLAPDANWNNLIERAESVAGADEARREAVMIMKRVPRN